MPNWCYNSMQITGTISEITRFKQTCIRTVSENEQAQLDFSAIVPPPDFSGDNNAWGDWAREHWGTTCDRGFHVTVDAPGCYEFHFYTAWDPPVPVWEKMAKMFPALEFSLSGYEPLADFAFEGMIQGGKLKLWDAPVIWTGTDAKTGEAISGTHAQVLPFVGEGLVLVRAGKANEIDGERQPWSST
jgi:hypothetical protein